MIKTQPISTPSQKKKMALQPASLATDGKMKIIFTLKNGKQLMLRNGSSFDLCEPVIRKTKTGEINKDWVAFAYYSRLHTALDGVMNHMLMASDAKSLSELQADVHDIRKKLIDCYEDNMQYEVQS